MFETELKFQVPPTQRAALHRAVATATARTTRLQAVYADTVDGRLAAAGLALRLRKEGRAWVQTLKGRGDGLMQRLEHEVRLPATSAAPTLDATLHAGTPVGDRLMSLLADGQALQPIYRTDIRRLHRRVRHGAALIELAYDRGWIMAGERRVVVDEIEFELMRGPRGALVELAQRWAGRHGLWWDVRTKSERGHRLALGLEQVPATFAAATSLPADAPAGQALASWVTGALAQALPNMAEMASGTAGTEHLHQLRLALRRLRNVLRVFAPLAVDPRPLLALEEDWREPFSQLGAARDQDVIGLALLPMLTSAQQAAGAPALEPLAPTPGPAPQDIVRSAVFTDLMLRTLALGESAPAEGRTPAALTQAVPAQIRPLWRQVRRGMGAFAQADAEQRHRLRKRLKRLRDALVCAQPLIKRRAASLLQRRLQKALKALGELNDLQVAEARYREEAGADPPAWFAVGYLVAQRQLAVSRAQRELERLRKIRIAWKAARKVG